MSSPTLDSIMATDPCVFWPQERVAATLELLGHPSSWTQLAERARDAGWPVSLVELRLTVYRVATPEQRLAGVMYSMRVSAEAITHEPDVPDAVARIYARLLAWADGTSEEALSAICDDAATVRAAANAAFAAYGDAADDASDPAANAAYTAANYACVAYATVYAAARAVANSSDASDAAAYANATTRTWASLAYICQLLDGGAP